MIIGDGHSKASAVLLLTDGRLLALTSFIDEASSLVQFDSIIVSGVYYAETCEELFHKLPSFGEAPLVCSDQYIILLQFAIQYSYCIIVIQFDVDCLCWVCVFSSLVLASIERLSCLGLAETKKKCGQCASSLQLVRPESDVDITENAWQLLHMQLPSSFMSFKIPDTCRPSETVPVEMKGKMSQVLASSIQHSSIFDL